MKFGKWLKRQMEETLPEWRDKFVCYKDLKKLVRLISEPSEAEAEADFIRRLNAEVDKFNAFFIEQEEDFIIRLKELQDQIRSAKQAVGPSQVDYAVEMGKIRKAIVDLHGEMVLLVNYSSINYTGLAKILKKYDKRTGGLLRLPFIEKVLKQPFFMTDLISRLVKECESTADAVFPVAGEGEEDQEAASQGRQRDAMAAAKQSILRNAIAALVTMRELRRGSSTYGRFSLPPLTLPDPDFTQSLQLPSPIPTQ